MEGGPLDYHDLMWAVFPEDQFPRAWRYQGNGGPPGCAMAFGRAIREMGGTVNYNPKTGSRTVYLPRT